MAERADRHKLYQEAVQNVEEEIDFVDERFEAMRGRKAESLREDFCGTANTACEWVRRRTTNRAIGVDLDNDVLQWGRENNIGKLDEEAKSRVNLLNEDVLTVRTEPVDVLLAMNFSYWLFQERTTLLNYFKSVRAALKDDGVFFCDAYGGWDAHRTITEARDCERFEYVWDQDEFDPITHRMKCFIHFKFPDGSKMKKAFSYEWRLWSLPELRELLAEAGFSKVTIYWEGADEDGDGNGEFEPVTEAESDPGWICYLVAEK
ncbi:MAG: class I SAM-dependent methyltransferase [Phycisphaeraceae bacterium]|nr:MAG: class I SAM-dependent methyltransferase [Phycisphaeraceae bacterium]